MKPFAGTNSTWVPFRIQVPLPGTTTRLPHLPVPVWAIATDPGLRLDPDAGRDSPTGVYLSGRADPGLTFCA